MVGYVESDDGGGEDAAELEGDRGGEGEGEEGGEEGGGQGGEEDAVPGVLGEEEGGRGEEDEDVRGKRRAVNTQMIFCKIQIIFYDIKID